MALSDATRPTATQSNGTSRTSRRAISDLIYGGDDEAEWTIGSVADALGLGEDTHHAIGVPSLAALAVNCERPSLRRRKGVYTKLPPATVTAGAGEERGGLLESGSQEGPGWAGDESSGAQVA